MEVLNTNQGFLALVITIFACFIASSVKGQNGQQTSAPCTASMISSFTPCMNYVTGSRSSGSSGTGTAPSSACCDAVKSLMGSSMDCYCMLMTANVPLPLSFINRTIALSLPRACKSGGVPIECKPTASPLPAPGPLALQFGPTPSPASALSPQVASKATSGAPAAEPAAEPAATELPPLASPPVEVATPPPTTPGVRPVPTPTASSPSTMSMPTISLMFMGFMVFKLL